MKKKKQREEARKKMTLRREESHYGCLSFSFSLHFPHFLLFDFCLLPSRQRERLLTSSATYGFLFFFGKILSLKQLKYHRFTFLRPPLS